MFRSLEKVQGGLSGFYPIRANNRWWLSPVETEADTRKRIFILKPAATHGAKYANNQARFPVSTRNSYIRQTSRNLRSPTRTVPWSGADRRSQIAPTSASHRLGIHDGRG